MLRMCYLVVLSARADLRRIFSGRSFGDFTDGC